MFTRFSLGSFTTAMGLRVSDDLKYFCPALIGAFGVVSVLWIYLLDSSVSSCETHFKDNKSFDFDVSCSADPSFNVFSVIA